MIEEYFYNLGLYDLAFGKDFSCSGLGGRLCGYTCGQCKETSTVDGSKLNCYAKWNRQQAVYQEMRSFIVLDTDLSCPLSGKSQKNQVAKEVVSEDEETENEDEEEWEAEDEDEEEEETEYEDAHDHENHEHDMQNDAIDSQVEENEITDQSLSYDVEPEDMSGIEAVLERSLSDAFSSCKISKKDGPRKINIQCTAKCSDKKQFVSLSKHNGQSGSFNFVCMGQKGKRYCVSENCGGGRPGANFQCNRCSLQFACADDSQDIEEILGYIPTDCENTQYLANF